MRPVRVLVQLGDDIARRVAAAVPEVEVVRVPFDGELPADAAGDVLLTIPLPSPHLRALVERGVAWVHVSSTGVDSFPLADAGDATVTCSRGATAVPIAEFVLAAMLAFEKRLPETWVTAPPEHWFVADLGTLAGRTLGLVGLGAIGSAVARRALAFDMRVLAARRRPEPSPLAGVDVVRGLEDVLTQADHLVLAAAATPRTRHLLDAGALALVEPGVHVVNVARGALVDHDALLAALDDGRVAMATLDVVDPEPLPAGHALYSHPRVRVSAHVSWSSPGMFDRVVDLFVENLRRAVAGEPLAGVVDRAEGY